MLQSGQGPDGGGGAAAASSLNALLRKSKKPALLTADQVEFWKAPEKAGWMHSQGEHIRTWRKRWFVLKQVRRVRVRGRGWVDLRPQQGPWRPRQRLLVSALPHLTPPPLALTHPQGFLFRFADQNVGPASKPRGIVDLSTVTDVADGGSTTGRPSSIKLSTGTGHICYLCDTETSQVRHAGGRGSVRAGRGGGWRRRSHHAFAARPGHRPSAASAPPQTEPCPRSL